MLQLRLAIQMRKQFDLAPIIHRLSRAAYLDLKLNPCLEGDPNYSKPCPRRQLAAFFYSEHGQVSQ